MLRWLISGLGAGLLKDELAARAERAGRRAALIALVALLWLAALGFAVGAFVTWLSQQLGPVAACAIVAGGLAILALIIQVTLRLSRGPTHRSKPRPSLADLGISEELASASPIGMVALVALLGYLLGRQAGHR